MARIVFEGNYKVYWVTTITTTSTPTKTEIEAGTNITAFVPKDGLRYGPGFNKVDASNLTSAFDPEYQGSWSMDAGLTVQRDDTANTAINLFTSHATAGHLVVLPEIGTAAIANGDKAYVIPCEASIAVPNNTAANALQTSEVDLAVTSEPKFAATVTT